MNVSDAYIIGTTEYEIPEGLNIPEYFIKVVGASQVLKDKGYIKRGDFVHPDTKGVQFCNKYVIFKFTDITGCISIS